MDEERPVAANMIRPAGEVALDDVDRAIVRILAADARTPNSTIARRVGVAPSTCLLRVRRLQETGVVRGFHADLGPEALGRPLQALVSVRLQSHARAALGSFAERLATLPGVLNVFFLAGANDFLVHVASTSPEDLREFVVRNLNAAREVASTETSLVFEHVPGRGLQPD
ncbi:Lrp/AsnC family transcriptional regulator [Nocardioides zeae]|uniref:Lrp/AsnC family transcriptional regulator n=1 Tax=Nocardioides imazamoxiresistens TaxID=3231893 RepID=A0ABU3PV02_9ACTN|nr:Lrp/AsnC family transcriptional regulator [Nocardioides zeae]MDT9593029.1 Lrp/AsnC family transcriptional regulator [Nocardioides zeae]